MSVTSFEVTVGSEVVVDKVWFEIRPSLSLLLQYSLPQLQSQEGA